MPRVKTPTMPWDPMRRLLRGYGLTATELASILQVSRPTASKRLQQPGTLTLDELFTINRRKGIPMDEIKEALRR